MYIKTGQVKGTTGEGKNYKFMYIFLKKIENLLYTCQHGREFDRPRAKNGPGPAALVAPPANPACTMLCVHTQRTHSVLLCPGGAPCKPCVSLCCDIYNICVCVCVCMCVCVCVCIYIYIDRGDTHPTNPASHCARAMLSRRPNTLS